MNRGESLDMALTPWIPHEEAMLIRAGVQGGKIPEALADCASLIEARRKIIGGVIGAVAYPSALMAILIMFMLFLAAYVMPEISTLSDPNGWSGSAALLYALTSFVASVWGLVFFLLAAALAAVALASLPYWTGKWRLKLEKLPPWSVYRLVVGSTWLFTVATLLRGGIQMETVFSDMLKSAMMRPWLRERVRAIKDRYRSEASLGQILLHLGMHFPDDELVEDLAVYSTLPNFHATLYDIAKEWLDEGVERLDKMSKILNAGLLFSIVAMTAWVAAAFRSLQEQLISGMGGF
jgi:type II secretory pathway component PulF